jgi:tetratricopeptide (TPR) repeat protein
LPRRPHSRRSNAALWSVLAALALNVLWRGGVDEGVVQLTLVLAAVAAGLAAWRAGDAPAPVAIAGLSAVAVLVTLQLVPVPFAGSAEARGIVEAAGRVGGFEAGWRPLSLAPGETGFELAKVAGWTLVAFAAALLAARPERKRALLRGIGLAGAAVVTVFLGAVVLGFAPLTEPKVTFVNPNNLAGFLNLTAWVVLGLGLRSRGVERVAWIVAFVFVAAGVFLSLSRGGIAAFFVGAGVFGVLRARAAAESGRPRLGGRAALAGTLGVSGALAVAAWLALGPIVEEMGTVSDARTTEVKLGLWGPAVEMIGVFPAFGIGRGAFETVYPAYKWEPLQATFTHVENTWLQLPLDLGIFAGLAVMVLFGWIWLAAALDREISAPLAGALAGAAALVLHNLFDFSLDVPGVALPFALVMGVAATRGRGVPLPAWALRGGVAAMAAAGVAGLLVWSAAPGAGAVGRLAAAPAADAARALAAEVMRWQPADYVPPAVVGTKLAAEGRCREAVPWLTHAMERNPTAPEAHRALGACLAAGGRRDLARREFRLAHAYGDREALRVAAGIFTGPLELLEVAPDTPAGLYAAGELRARERPEEAREAWRRGWESFRDPRALGRLADVTLALGDAEGALALARELQGVDPRAAAGYVVAARALDALGRGDEGQAELELGASRLPGEAGVLVPLGYRHMKEKRFSQARATFEKVVARGEAEVGRRAVHVARALEGQGRYAEALRSAQQARDAAPESVEALDLFARLAARVKRFDEAIDALELAGRKPGVPAGAFDARVAELREAKEAERLRWIEAGMGERGR